MPLRRLVQVSQQYAAAGGTVTDEYVTSYGYDLHDNLTSVTDANGHTSTYLFDDFGNLLEAVSPDTGTTQYRYIGTNLLRKKILADGTVIEYFYDDLDRLVRAEFPDAGQNIHYFYDEPGSTNGKGRLTRMTDPSGTTVLHYNALGQVTREVKTIDGTDYEVAYGYDANGSLASVTYPDGRVVSYTRNGYDRVTSIRQSLNGYASDVVSAAAHLPHGPVASLQFGGTAPAWSAGYGVRYQMETLAAGSVLGRSYGFDPAGNITAITDTLTPSKSMTFGYDSLGRLELADGPWGAGGYSYDPVGNRLTKSIGGLTTYTHVPGTNKLAAAAGAEPATFTHDAGGNMTADGTHTYVYSQNQRLIEVLVGGTPVGSYVYDGEGKRVKKTAGGQTTVFLYDRLGNTLAEVRKGAGPGGTDVHMDYVWLDTLRVAQVVGEVGEAPPGPCFIATVAFGSPLAAEAKTFRAFRDRYLNTNAPGRALVRLYEAQGPGAARFIEGREGLKGLVRGGLYPLAALCSHALEAPAWQKAGVLIVVTLLLPFGMIVLVSRLRGRGILEYRKAFCVLLAAVFTFEVVMLGYFGTGGGVKEAQAAVPAGITFYYNDHLGTPLRMVDASGAVVWSADYLPFGRATVDPASTVENHWRFPGQFWDGESGLHYNLMRFYAPGLGRYTRPDPVNLASVQVAGYMAYTSSTDVSIEELKYRPGLLNHYLYVANNAINFIDHQGEFIGIFIKLHNCIRMVKYASQLSQARDRCDLELRCIGGDEFMAKYDSGFESHAKLKCIEKMDPGTFNRFQRASVKCGFRWIF